MAKTTFDPKMTLADLWELCRKECLPEEDDPDRLYSARFLFYSGALAANDIIYAAFQMKTMKRGRDRYCSLQDELNVFLKELEEEVT